jgi:glycosyl transferase family 25
MEIDHVYCINCEHRTDRRLHIENVLQPLAWSEKITIFSAIYNSQNGSLGCALSHLSVLKMAQEKQYKNILILEDDFQIIDYTLLNEILTQLEDIEYDIIMLAGNLLETQETDYPFLRKVLMAQTTSGYLIQQNFISTLIENFTEAANYLDQGFDKDQWAIDQNWKKIQPLNRWYCLNPLVGKQIDDWSDIEKRYVTYQC